MSAFNHTQVAHGQRTKTTLAKAAAQKVKSGRVPLSERSEFMHQRKRSPCKTRISVFPCKTGCLLHDTLLYCAAVAKQPAKYKHTHSGQHRVFKNNRTCTEAGRIARSRSPITVLLCLLTPIRQQKRRTMYCHLHRCDRVWKQETADTQP